MKKSAMLLQMLRPPMDGLFVLAAFYFGYQIRLKGDFIPKIYFPVNENVLLPYAQYIEFSLIFAVMLISIFALFGVYKFENTGPLREMRQIFAPFCIWILSIMAYFFVIHETFFSRLVLFFSVFLSLILLVFGRLILREIKKLLIRCGLGKTKIILMGKNEISDKLMKALTKYPEFEVIRITSSNKSDLEKTFKETEAESFIQTQQNLSEEDEREILNFCRWNHLDYHFVPDILQLERSNIEIQTMAGLPLIHLKPTPLDGWGKIYKRCFDIVFAGFGLIAISPFMMIIAICIKLDSKGPILFSRLENHEPVLRVGQYGLLFPFYKFRSMRDKSHGERYSRLAHKNQRSGPLVKIKGDDRITKFGKFLRRFDLDELPQLWNVIMGHMSLVGPRPHLPEEVALYKEHHQFSLSIKPGITGLSQISGRSDLDFEEEVRLDSLYIKHWSPLMDLKIMLKTFAVIFKKHGAD